MTETSRQSLETVKHKSARVSICWIWVTMSLAIL